MRTAEAIERRSGGVVQPPESICIETLTSEAELAGLGGSWDRLVQAMPRPSPFLLHGWLHEWWLHYGNGDELAIHVAYRGDRLVGALPLYVHKRSGLRVAEFVGGSWAVLADAMLAPGEDEAVVRALVDHASSSGHDFASLFGLPGSSRVVAALPRGSLRLLERLEAPVLDLHEGWEAVYRAKMPSKARSERRRRRRQLEELGTVETSVARTPDELAPALEEAYRVHTLRWEGRHDPTGFVTETGMRFHRAAVARLSEAGVPRLTTLRLDGRAIAFAFALQLQGRAYGMNMAFDPAYARYAPGFEAKLVSLEAAAAEGVTCVELLGTAAPHKRRFTDRFDPVYQGIGLARTLRGRAAAEALADGIRLRRGIKRSGAAQRLYRLVPRPARG
ncbi:MAG TPA: GNAT family N-acetyltransferase [Gaiellaceae bacterium]|nr:GNAT family N-acetyltransferase [Gaiellaceae bacterium]